MVACLALLDRASADKNDTKIIEFGWLVWFYDNFVETQSFSNLHNLCELMVGEFSPCGIHTFFLCCVYTDQWTSRDNVWMVTKGRFLNPLTCENWTKIENDLVSRNGHRIKTTQLNSAFLVSVFSEDDILSNEIKTCNIFKLQSTENLPFPLFWDTLYTASKSTVIIQQSTSKLISILTLIMPHLQGSKDI